ncbi:hypothetical protein V6N13_109334 [Hibiscus sabdariffa]
MDYSLKVCSFFLFTVFIAVTLMVFEDENQVDMGDMLTKKMGVDQPEETCRKEARELNPLEQTRGASPSEASNQQYLDMEEILKTMEESMLREDSSNNNKKSWKNKRNDKG